MELEQAKAVVLAALDETIARLQANQDAASRARSAAVHGQIKMARKAHEWACVRRYNVERARSEVEHLGHE